MSPPRKDPIPNQDINMLATKKDQIFPSKLAKFCPGCKSLINETEYGRNDSTDTSGTDKYDYVKSLKAIHNENIDDEYKDENSQDYNINESLSTKLKKKKN